MDTIWRTKTLTELFVISFLELMVELSNGTMKQGLMKRGL